MVLIVEKVFVHVAASVLDQRSEPADDRHLAEGHRSRNQPSLRARSGVKRTPNRPRSPVVKCRYACGLPGQLSHGPCPNLPEDRSRLGPEVYSTPTTLGRCHSLAGGVIRNFVWGRVSVFGVYSLLFFGVASNFLGGYSHIWADSLHTTESNVLDGIFTGGRANL